MPPYSLYRALILAHKVLAVVGCPLAHRQGWEGGTGRTIELAELPGRKREIKYIYFFTVIFYDFVCILYVYKLSLTSPVVFLVALHTWLKFVGMTMRLVFADEHTGLQRTVDWTEPQCVCVCVLLMSLLERDRGRAGYSQIF